MSPSHPPCFTTTLRHTDRHDVSLSLPNSEGDYRRHNNNYANTSRATMPQRHCATRPLHNSATAQQLHRAGAPPRSRATTQEGHRATAPPHNSVTAQERQESTPRKSATTQLRNGATVQMRHCYAQQLRQCTTTSTSLHTSERLLCDTTSLSTIWREFLYDQAFSPPLKGSHL